MKNEEAVPGELLVRFEDGVSAVEIDRVNARLGVEVINRMAGGKLIHVRAHSGQSLEPLAEAYRSTPGVRYVEINVLYQIDEPKTDQGSQFSGDTELNPQLRKKKGIGDK